ncbi:hypothetical protein HPB49_014457 [Dermacentor silvarum]|uniref:Uncharacterized protein n=1 Tax=Dermacentor silvarum TaxID=543639 RepID=A0ACB8E062_DERSI|nr:hypothetical protein HPB49_014457 [Dermacentor silvarum]
MSYGRDYKVLSTDECKGQLGFNRPCGAVNSKKTCWLPGDLTSWNRMLHELAFELVETSPGELLLCAMTYAGLEREPTSAAHDASLLVSSLLCHHTCIQHLEVRCAIRDNAPAVPPPYPIRIRASWSTMPARRSLRSLNIYESPGALLHLRDLDAIVDLETVFVDAVKSNLHTLPQVKALLERNWSTLKKVSIRQHSRHEQHGDVLESMVACEFLTPKSPDDRREMPEADAISTMMGMSAALKEVTAQLILLSAIANALVTNLTLTKRARGFHSFSAHPTIAVCSRMSLTRQLLVDGCYDRVRLGPWTEPGLRFLLALLPSQHTGPEQLWLPNIGQLSHNTVRDLFNVLASSKSVKHLVVEVKLTPDARVAALCEALKMNGSVSYLHITIGNELSARNVLHALSVNAAITKLDITLRVPSEEQTMGAFSSMLQHNNSLTKVSVCLYVRRRSRFMEAIAQGLSRNKLVVEFWSWANGYEYVPFAILEAVRRNKCALNRALEFVLKTREDRHSAECFDRFSARSCLLTNLTEVTGVSEVEARLVVVSAKHRLQEKYLVLTGVVRHSLVCRPAEVTQIDALNEDCWRAIPRYLRISDVCIV